MNRGAAAIVVVDDEPTILRLLGEVQAEEGHATSAAPNGTSALGLLGGRRGNGS